MEETTEIQRPAGGWPARTSHQLRVVQFLTGIGRELPAVPQLAAEDLRLTWCRLLLEETLELCEAAGVAVHVRDKGGNTARQISFADLSVAPAGFPAPSLPEIAKESADVSVIAAGMMAINGIGDKQVLEAVDNNNLLKVKTGRKCPTTGKWLKSPDHPKTDVKSVLLYQGWNPDGNQHHGSGNG